MRRIEYVLSNGAVTVSFREAKASGLEFKSRFVDVPTDLGTVSPIRQAMLDQFGYVSEKLLDKVVLP